MKIPRSLRRVKFHSAAHHTTSFAGLRFVFDLAHKLGLTQDLRTLTVKKRRRGIPIEDFVLGLASNFLVGAGRGRSNRDMKLNMWVRNSAPLWCQSSPMNQSVTGAWGETATSAGWASIMPAAV